MKIISTILTTLFLTAALLIITTLTTFSQGVVITEEVNGEAEPHGSALFELRSKDRGILVPKMTTLEREAIVSPANGLLVFDEDEMSFFYYDASANEGAGAWVRLMSNEQDLILLATKAALGDSTAQVRSEIPDVSGFLTSETDPVYGSSVASGITGTDTTNWNNKLDSETDPSVPVGTQTGEMQYWNGSEWITIAAGNEAQVLTFSGGIPTWKTQLEDGEVENLTTGEVWMDRNLGASRVATSSTDSEAYGHLYQWGRAADGHQIRTSNTTSTLSSSDTPGHGNFILAPNSPYDWRNPENDNLWQGISGTNNPCPDGYRLPTEAEWEAERLSWGSNNAAGAFASPLKLPMAGYRFISDGSISDVGSSGIYWSSTLDLTGVRTPHFSSSGGTINRSYRAHGISVRCIKD